MKLIINKALDNINDSVNIKIIEITSTNFLSNTLGYFVYKHQIPLIKFVDTGEIFNVKNFKSRLNSSLAETPIIIDITDLELISSSGSASSQNFQSVTDIGVSTTNSFYKKVSDVDETIKSGVFEAEGVEEGIQFMGHRSILVDGMYVFGMALGETGSLVHSNTDPLTPYINSFQLPIKANGIYTLATLSDILKIANVPVYATNAAAITGGLVADNIYKTVTGELRIVV
jgi:hypothetical protein